MSRVQLPRQQNLLLQSDDFASASWNVVTFPVTVTSNSVVAPDGTQTADVLTAPAGVNIHGAFQLISGLSVGPRVQTMSVYAKQAANTTWIEIADVQHTLQFYRAWFNLATGTVGTQNNATATIEALPNADFPSAPAGWFRCSVTYTFQQPQTNDGNPTVLGFIVQPTSGDNVQSYNGAGEDVAVWRAQVAQANWAGPPCLTTAAAVNTGPIRSRP